MTPDQKAWIDGSSYEDLLRRNRFGESGDTIFQGKCGDYFVKVMAEKRAADPVGHVAASKRIGWYPL